LIKTQLLQIESIIDGDLSVIPISGKNRNFKIVRKYKQSYFLKSSPDSYNNDMLRKEAQIYYLVQNECDFAPLKEIIPELVLFDDEKNILIVDMISNGETLGQYYRGRNSQDIDTERAAIYGKVMAMYHNFFKDRNKINKFSFLPKKLPFGLFVLRPGPEIFTEISSANLQLLKIIQQHHEFRNIVTDFQAEWCVQTLIHGDIRWENAIVSSSQDDANNSLKM